METDTVLGHLGTLALNACNKGNPELFKQLTRLGKARDPASIAKAINIVNISKQRSQDDLLMPKVCLRQIHQEAATLLIKDGGISSSCFFVVGWGNFEISLVVYDNQQAAQDDVEFRSKNHEIVLSNYGFEIMASIKFSRMLIDQNIPCMFVEQHGAAFTQKIIRNIPRDIPKGCKINSKMIFRHPVVLANYDMFYRMLDNIRGDFIVATFWPNKLPGICSFYNKANGKTNAKANAKAALFKIGAPMAFVYERATGKIILETYPASMF
jgi:hypothetical protein